MIKQKEQEVRSCYEHDARVSQALWPVNTRRAVATDWIAQRRRQLKLMLQGWKSFPSLAGKSRLPETPVPEPLVRVLETVDLSKTDVEHFVDKQEVTDSKPYDAGQGRSVLVTEKSRPTCDI